MIKMKKKITIQQLQTKKFFENNATSWANEAKLKSNKIENAGHSRSKFVLDLITKHKLKYHLDVGCGTGDLVYSSSRFTKESVGIDFSEKLELVVGRTILKNKATIFGYDVANPQRYGVIEFDSGGNCISLEEKPLNPKSNKAVVGLYFYPNSVIEVAKSIPPSKRGELEITSVNEYYLNKGKLIVEQLGTGFTWLDTGTHESLIEAGQFIETIENRQGVKVACLEELAFQMGYIPKQQMLERASQMKDTSYGDYLIRKYSK